MEFFENVFNSIADVSSSLPAISIGTFFIVVLAFVIGDGLVCGLTYFASSAYKMKVASKKVIKYLSGVEEINDDNVSYFTNACFSNSTPRHFREAWVKYLGVEFGYPSEIVSEKYVFEGDVKKQSNARANVFIAVALILIGVLAFWGFGVENSASMAVIVGAGLILSGIIYLVLLVIGKKLFQQARSAFYDMQDDLDAKVNFHVEKDYSTDTSPLIEMTSIIDEIIAKNIAKKIDIPETENTSEKVEENEPKFEVEYPTSQNGETPIEELIDNASDETAEKTENTVESVETAEKTVENEEIEPAKEQKKIVDEIPSASVDEQFIDDESSVDEQSENDEEYDAEYAGKLEEITQLINSSMAAATIEKQNPVNVMKQEGVGDWLAGQNEFGMASPVEAFEEVNVKDDEIMFGKKKKEAKLAAEQAAAAQSPAEQFVESKIDEEIEEVAEPALEEVAPVEEPVAEPVSEQAPAQKDELPAEFSRAFAETAPVAEIQPEIIEQFEDLDEGDDEIKAPRLAKLPHLVDYIVADSKTTKATKVKMAQLMLQAYTVFKKSPENKVIILQCLKKVMDSLKPEN